MIYAILYLIFIVLIAIDLFSARKLFAAFPPGLLGLALLALVMLLSAVSALAFGIGMIPASLVYPVPWLLLVFIPGYVVAKWLSHRYESQGTADTQRLEDVCARVGWVAIFGAALVFVNLVLIWLRSGDMVK